VSVGCNLWHTNVDVSSDHLGTRRYWIEPKRKYVAKQLSAVYTYNIHEYGCEFDESALRIFTAPLASNDA